MSSFYHSTVVVEGFGDDENSLREANAEAVLRFGDSRVSRIHRPVNAQIGHASFFVSPSGVKNDSNEDLRLYTRWLRNKCPYLDFVRVLFGEGCRAEVMDQPDITEKDTRCEHCDSFRVSPEPDRDTATFRWFCGDCQHYGDKTHPLRDPAKANPDFRKKELAQALNVFLHEAPPETTGTEMVLKTEMGERIAVRVTWERLT